MQLRISLGGILQCMISDDSRQLEDSILSYQEEVEDDGESISEDLLMSSHVSLPLNKSAISLTEEFIGAGGGSSEGSISTPPLSFADNDPVAAGVGGGDLSQTLSLEYSKKQGSERNIRRFPHLEGEDDVEEKDSVVANDGGEEKDISLDLGSVSLDLSKNEDVTDGVGLDLDISAGKYRLVSTTNSNLMAI